MTTSDQSFTDRLLGLAGTAEPDVREGKIVWFRRFLLMHLAVQAWFTLSVKGYSMEDLVFAGFLSLTFLAGLNKRWNAQAGDAALVVVLVQVLFDLPFTANHHYLELCLLLVLSLFSGQREDESDLALKGLRWLTAIALFQTGLQKLLYGYYFNGSMFVFMASVQSRFADFFGRFMAEDELLRIQSYGWPAQTGAGPYLVASLAIVVMANATWILEMLLPVGLMTDRFRRVALWLAVAMIIVIEIAAREVFLGALFINLLLLFSRGNLNRKLFPAFLLLYAALGAVAAGWLPRWGLT